MSDGLSTSGVRTLPKGFRLSAGIHEPGPEMCVMEAVAWLAGEGWTDTPDCVARTLQRYTIALNDSAPDAVRQRLLDYVPMLVGTGPELLEVARERAYLCADYAVRVFSPLALEARGQGDAAASLRGLAPVTSRETAAAAREAAQSILVGVVTAAVTSASTSAAFAACIPVDLSRYGPYAVDFDTEAAAAAAAAAGTSYALVAGDGTEAWRAPYRLLDALIRVGKEQR